jgi:signal transduction histidine kinase
MNLDARTIVFIITFGSLLIGIALFAVSRASLGQVKALSRWAKATLLQALAWGVLGVFRGVIPDVVSIVVGQALLLSSYIWYLFILAEFNGQAIKPWFYLSLPLIEACFTTYYTIFQLDFAARNVWISLLVAIVILKSAQLLFSSVDKHLFSVRFLAAVYFFCGVFLLFRSFYYAVLNTNPATAPFGANPINDFAFLVFYVFAVFLSFGFVLICIDRFSLQQKQTEAQLKDAIALFARLSEQVPGAIYQFQLAPDGNACFPYASEGIKQIYEVTPEQVMQNASQVFSRLHPDDQEKVEDSIQKSATSLQPWRCQYRVILPEQGLRWRQGQAQPEKLSDGSILWHGFITDITEQALAAEKNKQLEDEILKNYQALQINEMRLRRLMNSSLIGMMECDSTGRMIDANDVLLQMLDLPRDALGAMPMKDSGVNWFSLSTQSESSKQRLAVASLAQSDTVAPFETEIIVGDARPIPVMLGVSRLEQSEDEWVGFVLDLREQKRVDHLKSEFISIVSHELRTPLTSIRGSLGLLESGVAGELPEKALNLVKIANRNSQRLSNLVNDILDLEKLAKGQMTMSLQSLDLCQLVQQAMDANTAYAQMHHVRFELHTDLKIAVVWGDLDRLMQVMANLLSNAAKFSPMGALVTIRILPDHDYYQVQVEDHGAGIPAAFHSQIFGKFAQASHAAVRQKEGAGLGLHISKVLIEKMQGQIGFVSEEGVHTMFWIRLPKHSV